MDNKTILVRYQKQNPIKFVHKYGDIDLDSVPDSFDFAKYKKQVATERSFRDQNGLPQHDPRRLITPELFAPAPTKAEVAAAVDVSEAEEIPKPKRAKKTA